MALRVALVSLAAVLLAAHFLRWGNLPLTASSLLFPFLLFVPRRWALRTVQALTFAGAGVWSLAAYRFVRMRVLMEEAWLRMAIILGAVIAVTLLAGLLLGSGSVLRRYLPADSTNG